MEFYWTVTSDSDIFLNNNPGSFRNATNLNVAGYQVAVVDFHCSNKTNQAVIISSDIIVPPGFGDGHKNVMRILKPSRPIPFPIYHNLRFERLETIGIQLRLANDNDLPDLGRVFVTLHFRADVR